MVQKQVAWKLFQGVTLLSLLLLCACSVIVLAFHGCSLVNCIGSLRVRLVGTIPDSYTIEVSSDDGRTVVIKCQNVSVIEDDHLLYKPGPIFPITDEMVKSDPELSDTAAMCGSEVGFVKWNVA